MRSLSCGLFAGLVLFCAVAEEASTRQDADPRDAEIARLRAELERVSAELLRLRLRTARSEEHLALVREGLAAPYPLVQDAALQFAAGLPPERFRELVPDLRAFIERPPAERAAVAVGVLRDFGDLAETRDALLEARSIRHRDVLRAVAEALGTCRFPEAVEALREMLHDPDFPRVRSAAIQALVAQATDSTREEIGEWLLVRLRQETAEPVRQRAIEALGALRHRAAVETLVEILQGEAASAAVVWETISALGRIGDSAAAEVVARHVARGQPENIRLVALQALAAMGDPSTADVVRTALRVDPAPPNRAAAAEVLAVLAGLDDIGAVLLPAYATESDACVRSALLGAAQRIVGDDPDRRLALLRALVERGLYAEADQYCRTLHAVTQDEEDARRHWALGRQLAMALLEQGHTAEALVHLRYLTEHLPSDEQLVEVALACWSQVGAPPEEIAWLAAQVGRTPHEAPVYWRLRARQVDLLEAQQDWAALAAAAQAVALANPATPPEMLRTRAEQAHRRAVQELAYQTCDPALEPVARQAAAAALRNLGRPSAPLLVDIFEAPQTASELRYAIHSILEAVTGEQVELPEDPTSQQVREIAENWRRVLGAR